MVIRNFSIIYFSVVFLILKWYDFLFEFLYFCDVVSKFFLYDLYKYNFLCVEFNLIYDNYKIIWVVLLVLLFFFLVKCWCRIVLFSVYVMNNVFV